MMIASRRRSRAASAIVRCRTAEPVATSSGASTDPDPEPHLIRCQTSEKIAASGWRTEGRGMSRPKRGDVMTHITRARTTLVIIAVAAGVLAASAAAQQFLNAGKLTVAPCLGTDELSPLRFGSKGKLGFSFGNAAQDEGAAAAEFAYKSKGWKSAVVVTDNLLRYFQDVCKAFTVRFTELGGKIVSQESFTQGDNTINNVVSRVNNEKSDTIAFCTSFGGDQPAFVSGLRSLKNNTPIINGWASDGNYWWPTSPPVTNFYYLTYASVYGDDPSASVRAFEAKMKTAGQAAQAGG